MGLNQGRFSYIKRCLDRQKCLAPVDFLQTSLFIGFSSDLKIIATPLKVIN